MKKFIYAKSILSILFFGIVQFASGQGFSTRVQSRLQHVMDSFQNNSTVPFVGGMSVAIKVDGLAIWQGASGYAARNIDAQNNLLPGGTPFTTKTLSSIYSVTKTFTTALVLELEKEGVFRLNDAVSKYIPLNAINPSLNTQVTIGQLLAHESGYSNYTDEFNLLVAVAAQPTHVWTPFEMLTFVHQVANPGAERRYSSTNYIMLGAIVEAATGKKIEQFYRERFFDPLRLKSMYLSVREGKPDHRVLASPHDNISAFNPVFQQTGQPLFPDAYTNISQFPFTAINSLAFTGGGIVSDAKDLADFSSALFSGRATGKSILNTMLNSISPTPDDDGDKLGYGIWISTRMSATEVFIGHDGSAPGYRSVMFYQPDKKLSLVVLTNFYGADIYAIAKALYAEIPDFTCGNEQDDKVEVCIRGRNLCVPRFLAFWLIHYGATLGKCDNTSVPIAKSSIEGSNSKINALSIVENKLESFPNPFVNNITFSFKTAESGKATIKLYDLNGKLLATVFDGFVQKGIEQKVTYHGSKLPAGLYLSRLQTPSGTIENRLIRTR